MGQGRNEVMASPGSMNARESANPEEMESARLEVIWLQGAEVLGQWRSLARKRRSKTWISTPVRPR